MSSYKKEDPGDILVCENSGIEEETANRNRNKLSEKAEQLAVLYMSSLFLEDFGIIFSQITVQQNQFLLVQNGISIALIRLCRHMYT